MATRGKFRHGASMLIAAVLVGTTLGILTAGASTSHVVKVERIAHLGTVLFSERGFALYTYGRDTRNHSNCNGTCLAAWPALTVAKGVTPTGVSGLGVIVRSNGQHQVTWHHHPLYTFTSDAKGKVTGNGVAGFHAAVLKKVTPSATTTTATKSYGY